MQIFANFVWRFTNRLEYMFISFSIGVMTVASSFPLFYVLSVEWNYVVVVALQKLKLISIIIKKIFDQFTLRCSIIFKKCYYLNFCTYEYDFLVTNNTSSRLSC